jgi:HSP20 family protein
MAALVRWNPIREMDRVQTVMDRLFNDAFYRPWFGIRSTEAVGSVPVDVYESADEFVVKAPMPGVTSENLDVTYEAGVLTIRGEVPEEKEVQGECVCQERGFGKFARSISLPGDIVADKIVASLKDGVLTLHLPKAEEIKPKKINVKVG